MQGLGFFFFLFPPSPDKARTIFCQLCPRMVMGVGVAEGSEDYAPPSLMFIHPVSTSLSIDC